LLSSKGLVTDHFGTEAKARPWSSWICSYILLMGRVTARCRSNSKLPELVELFLSRPLVAVPLAAKLLQVTPKAVDLMLAQLGGALLCELTDRIRYHAWGIV
jgi:hypothetical protein